MNPRIAERFRQKETEWNFNTIVGGKEVSSKDIEEFRLKAEAEEKRKFEEQKQEIKDSREIVAPEELTKTLLQQYDIPAEPVKEAEGEKSFRGLEDFNRWYLSNRESFPEKQRLALNTLTSIETLITNGCKCKEEARRGQAHAYYQNFFISNQHTDLIDGIKKVGGFSHVKFYSIGSEAPFLEQ